MASKQSERLRCLDRFAELDARDLYLRRTLAKHLVARRIKLSKDERAEVARLIKGEKKEKRDEALRQLADRLPQRAKDV